MIAESLLDTNILVYAAGGRDKEEAKRKRAVELLEKENFGLSVQVLQEFYVTVVRKIDIPLTPEQAIQWIEKLEVFPCISIDAALVKIGIEHSVRYKISYWDGAIIAAAESLGATKLYSEDLNHEQRYGAIQVINPFLRER